MDKLTAIKIKYPNGTYSEQILLSVLAENVQVNSTTALSDALDLIDARIDQIVAPTSSTLTLDEEVRDIRVGKDATRTTTVNYVNAGAAVRTQLDEMRTSLDNDISDLKNAIFSLPYNSNSVTLLTATESNPLNADDIRTPGNYRISNVSNAKYISNLPIAFGGRLTVTTPNTSTGIIQFYTIATSTKVRVFVRNYYNNVWNEWVEIATLKDIESAIEEIEENDILLLKNSIINNAISYNSSVVYWNSFHSSLPIDTTYVKTRIGVDQINEVSTFSGMSVDNSGTSKGNIFIKLSGLLDRGGTVSERNNFDKEITLKANNEYKLIIKKISGSIESHSSFPDTPEQITINLGSVGSAAITNSNDVSTITYTPVTDEDVNIYATFAGGLIIEELKMSIVLLNETSNLNFLLPEGTMYE